MLLLHVMTEGDAGGGITVAERIFRTLLRRITLGELPPGSDVTEEGLAASLEVSRTPLREAVRRLEGMGILGRRANRMLFVPPLSEAEMRDLSITREALEVAVLTEVLHRLREGETSLEKLEFIHERMKQLVNLDAKYTTLEYGLDFHRELYKLANLPIATTILDQVLIRIERYRQLVKNDVARSRNVVAEHEKLLEALKSNDEAGAQEAMRRHIRAGRGMYVEKLHNSASAETV